MSKFNEIQEESFNDTFCDYLERHLDRTLVKFIDKRINSLSGDGIIPPFMDKQLTKKNVNDTRQILGVTVFFLGGEFKTDNTVYDLTIKFGKYSLRRYAKGSSMIDCIPSEESTDWISIDPENYKMEIRLK